MRFKARKGEVKDRSKIFGGNKKSHEKRHSGELIIALDPSENAKSINRE